MSRPTDRESGGAKFSVRHRTEFHYSNWITGNANTLHLEPRDFLFQKTLGSVVKVMPPTRLNRSTDLFGNITHAFEIGTQHRRMVVESQIRVINLPLHIPNDGYSGGMGFFRSPGIVERCHSYLHESRWVSLNPEIWKAAVDVTATEDAVFGKAAAIMRWINSEFCYEPGITDAETHLETAFALRKGVCQDFAHIMLGMCRSVGIPARYASGYIFTGGKNELVGAQASHAWCEVYLPETGWIGFDPTNAVLADHRYIKIAVGRDYGDVAPILGRYKGSAECTMEVSVSVERI
ncbi:transglutaminase family protein [Akkermansiaceae bacterium]|nr:transglutaminase family protein [Akkermansiaceae bacterium]